MENLHPNIRDLLLMVHTKHIATMGAKEKEKHALINIVKVIVDIEERCLKVYYKHEWYHYTPQGAWY